MKRVLASKMITKEKKSLYNRKQTLYFFVFISPWLICFILFGAFPLLSSLYFSFTKYNISSPPVWVGILNFSLLFKDEVFYKALSNTAVFTFVKMPFSVILSLIAALILKQKLLGIKVFRTLFYIPAIVPAAATILVWVFIFDSQGGLMNSVVGYLDFPPFNFIIKTIFGEQPISWLGEKNVLKSLIFMSLWGIGPTMLIFIAALQGVPQNYYEALELDGGNKIHAFRYITLPMISPTLLYVVLTGMIASLQVYAEMLLATGGGPNYASISLVYLVYQYTFSIPIRMGMASALSWIILGITVLLSILVFKNASKRVFYMGED